MSIFSNKSKHVEDWAFFGLLFALLGLVGWILRDFWLSIIWAAIFASLFFSLYEWLYSKFKRSVLAALVTLTILVTSVLGPLILIGISVATEVYGVSQDIADNPEWLGGLQTQFDTLTQNLPLASLFPENDIAQIVQSSAAWFGNQSLGWLQTLSSQTINIVTKTLIMLLVMFYFLTDGKMFIERLIEYLPFGDDDERELITIFSTTARATLKTTLVTALIQGGISGIFYYIVGAPATLVLIIVTILLAIIPAIGPNLILIPMALWYLMSANYVAMILMIVAAVITSVLDTVLRPILMGKDAALHPLLILLGTVGGLSVVGVSGLVVGPILMAFLVAVLRMYRRRYPALLK